MTEGIRNSRPVKVAPVPAGQSANNPHPSGTNLRGNKRLANAPAHFVTDGDILQVGVAGDSRPVLVLRLVKTGVMRPVFGFTSIGKAST